MDEVMCPYNKLIYSQTHGSSIHYLSLDRAVQSPPPPDGHLPGQRPELLHSPSSRLFTRRPRISSPLPSYHAREGLTWPQPAQGLHFPASTPIAGLQHGRFTMYMTK